jgi:hypothetical protein
MQPTNQLIKCEERVRLSSERAGEASLMEHLGVPGSGLCLMHRQQPLVLFQLALLTVNGVPVNVGARIQAVNSMTPQSESRERRKRQQRVRRAPKVQGS